jgi:REP-associated tyrosine transposase
MDDADRFYRRSIRLPGYDYAQDGAYFVTICTQERLCVFGGVSGGKMLHNDAGRMVGRWFLELEKKHETVRCDDYVVMPNHFHGIVEFKGENVDGDEQGAHAGAPLQTIDGDDVDNDGVVALAHVIQWFKTMSTNEYIRKVKQHDWPPFPGRLWQRNYYERIIRSDTELNRIREYIVQNPATWDTDELNPKHP